MKNKWRIVKIIGLLFCILSLICFIISIFQEENKIFLTIGLICNAIALIISIFINNKEKNKLQFLRR